MLGLVLADGLLELAEAFFAFLELFLGASTSALPAESRSGGVGVVNGAIPGAGAGVGTWELGGNKAGGGCVTGAGDGGVGWGTDAPMDGPPGRGGAGLGEIAGFGLGAATLSLGAGATDPPGMLSFKLGPGGGVGFADITKSTFGGIFGYNVRQFFRGSLLKSLPFN